MTKARYRSTEVDAAQSYAKRLRKIVSDHVRVVRGGGQIVVNVVEDERRSAQGPPPRTPERRRSAG
jgi:hypothetical protein